MGLTYVPSYVSCVQIGSEQKYLSSDFCCVFNYFFIIVLELEYLDQGHLVGSIG